MQQLFGGIEAGGTKFVCAVGTDPDHIEAQVHFPTTTPDDTFGRAVAFFQAYSGRLQGVGIGSFGPVDLNPESESYGYITSTPKPNWGNARFKGRIEDDLGVPVAFDTDVNAAAEGEYRWGAARGLDTFVYLTVGTGIGGGAMVQGRRLHGLIHPEMGHIPVPRAENDAFPGVCPYHGDCLEGMASGPAIEKRWGSGGQSLPPDHAAWATEAAYLARALTTYIYVLSPQRIILGGGVMHQTHLYPMVRKRVQELLGGYIQAHEVSDVGLESFIVAPQLGDRAGVLGALALALNATEN